MCSIWAEDNPPGLAGRVHLVMVELVGRAKPVHLKKYPMTMKARKRIKTPWTEAFGSREIDSV